MIKIKIKDIEYTMDEARELYDELTSIFGVPKRTFDPYRDRLGIPPEYPGDNPLKKTWYCEDTNETNNSRQ
jgi:hypothetical protein